VCFYSTDVVLPCAAAGCGGRQWMVRWLRINLFLYAVRFSCHFGIRFLNHIPKMIGKPLYNHFTYSTTILWINGYPFCLQLSAQRVQEKRSPFRHRRSGMRASRLTVRGVHLIRLKRSLPRLNLRNTRAARITCVTAAMGSDNKPEHPFEYDIYVIGISKLPFLCKD